MVTLRSPTSDFEPRAQSTDESTPKGASRRGIIGILLAVWLGVTLARLMHAEPLTSANDRSRWCTVWSLVEKGNLPD